MNIYICSLLSKKNLKFLSSFLKSLNKLKIPGNCKLKIIFVINPKIYIVKNFKFFSYIDYLILEV